MSYGSLPVFAIAPLLSTSQTLDGTRVCSKIHPGMSISRPLNICFTRVLRGEVNCKDTYSLYG